MDNYLHIGHTERDREIGYGKSYIATYRKTRLLNHSVTFASAHDGGASERESDRDVVPTHHPPQPRHGPAQGAGQGGVGRGGGRG
eukprot:4700977-Pleurochrysis_carterae.AAC.1